MANLIWTPSNPSQANYLQPAKMRENIAALAAQGLGINLLGDPTFICWPDTDGGVNLQGYWHGVTGGSGTVTRETGAGNYLFDGMSAKLTYSSGYAEIYQKILTTNADMTPFRGRYFSAGCWIKSSVASSARLRILDGVSSASSFHSGGGEWEWITVTRQLDASATYLWLSLASIVSGVAYVDGATLVMGQIPPPDYIPAAWKSLPFAVRIPGDPVTTGSKQYYEHTKPFVVRSTYIGARSTVAGQELIVDVNHYDAGWYSMYSTRPDVDVGVARGYAEPDGTYRYRCFQGRADGGSLNDGLMSVDVDQAPTSGGKFPIVEVICHAWDRPLDQHNAFNDI